MAAMSPAATLRGTESQPHAAAVLSPALPPAGEPSHAYLFHGPQGSGKRAVARAFASLLLSDGQDREHVDERVARGTHPDLTWVRPTGAAEMLVSDIDEPVVAAASRTPFEAPRRVFVIEGADTMNDRAANKLLKTLEEPPHFAHLILLADRREDVLPTILSRCQLVRFDPLPPAAIEQRLAGLAPEAAAVRLTPQTAAACARLSLGDAALATWLAGEQGGQLRTAVEQLVSALLEDRRAIAPPWANLLAAAGAAGEAAAEQVVDAVQAELELLPSKERRRREREGAEAARRAQRRERTRTLDLGLRLLELWLRDMLCICEQAIELVHARDKLDELKADVGRLRQAGGDPRRLLDAIELVCLTRASLAQNVSEELALEALCYRLRSAIAPRFGVSP